MVLRHADANEEANAAAVREARFIYLSGGSPLHLLSVLKGSLVFDALANAWRHGAVVAGSSAGAMVLVDPMVDPRGGAFTVGLGLVEQLAVVPHHDSGAAHHFWRTLELAPAGIPDRRHPRADGAHPRDGRLVAIGGRQDRSPSTSTASKPASRPCPARASGRRLGGSVQLGDRDRLDDDLLLGRPDRFPTASIAATTSRPETS